jgi:AcrR family transcriptional regulator
MPRAIPEERFQALIEAATAVFLAQGYRRTQVADVAARLQVSKGSIYTYVESKRALLHCVLWHADRRERIELPQTLPVPTPLPGATLAMVEKRLAEEGSLPALGAALSRTRVADASAELAAILGELYDALARNRTAIKLLDRCAPDFPELATVWYREGREGALALLASYLDDRGRGGRLRRFEDTAIAARIVLETLVFWSVHRHWDPSPQQLDEDAARRSVLSFLIASLVPARPPRPRDTAR